MFGNSNEKTNFLHRLLLNHTWVSRLRKAFENSSPANIKLSKAQLYKTGKSLSGIMRPLLKNDFPLMKNVLKPISKSVLTLLGLVAASWVTDTAI